MLLSSILMLCAFIFLAGRAVHLNVLNKDFLQRQGDARSLRVITEPAHRGMILDRNGEPLAISTPVKSVWAEPDELLGSGGEGVRRLAGVLSLDVNTLQQTLRSKKGKEFVYLKRQITPDLVARIDALHLPGIGFQREFRRYYPSREVSAHFLGLTNVDDLGQEGIELAFNSVLRGVSGSKRVIKDRLGRVVENVENVKTPVPGEDVVVSLDRRLQYLAYRELKAAVEQHKALSGSLVTLDVRTGEVLAMTNYPSFNPNNRDEIDSEYVRNRAVTDSFEPGSTVKPFTVLAGLESGKFTSDTVINTHPGILRVGRNRIHDHRDYGEIDLETILQKSSNVGATKIALGVEPERFWRIFSAMGFGSTSTSQFPGEVSGSLAHYSKWRSIERATLSYGYGLSTTALQLARAYTVFGNATRIKPISLEKKSYLDIYEGEDPGVRRENVFAVRRMLESVTHPGGTGSLAAINGYRVAGKTGTVEKLGPQGYQNDKHVALFCGVAPASDPRLVVVVVIDDPQGKTHFGGSVAAPVFAKVMGGALRMLNVTPDAIDIPDSDSRVALLDN